MAKIVFLQNLWWTHQGTMILSSVLKRAGHKVEVYILNNISIPKEIYLEKPDVIAFSSITGQHKWVLSIAKEIKRNFPKDLVTIMGGPHATFIPEVIENPYVDIVCRGEGEEALLELCNRLDKKEDKSDILNLWIKNNGTIYKNDVRPLIPDLDRLPLPDRTIYYKYRFLKDNPVKGFMFSRGCAYDCSFCYNHIYKQLYKGKGRYIRYRSIEQCIEELKMVKSLYGMRMVSLEDDTLHLDKDWLYEFLDRYKKEIKLPFFCNIRADIDSEEIIKALSYAGCSGVYFGIESGDEYLRNNLLKKEVTDNQIIQLAKWLKKYRIRMWTENMFCLPHETFSQALKTIKVNQDIKPDGLCAEIFQPYPKTELAEYLLRNRLIEKSDFEKIGASYRSSILKQKDIPQIINLYCFSRILVRLPFIYPIIKILIRFPKNRFFHLIYKLSYGYDYSRRMRVTLWQLVKECCHHRYYHMEDLI